MIFEIFWLKQYNLEVFYQKNVSYSIFVFLYQTICYIYNQILLINCFKEAGGKTIQHDRIQNNPF